MTYIVDPTDAWVRPEPDVLLSVSQGIQDALGPFTSLSGTLGWLCDMMFGSNPFDWINDQFGGDWTTISTAAVCLNQMSVWLDSVTDNAEYHAWSFSTDWTGHAALAARGQFLDMHAALEPAADLVRECGDATSHLASQVYLAAVLVATLVEAALVLVVAKFCPPALVLAVPYAISLASDIGTYVPIALAELRVLIDILQGQAASLSALPAISLTSGYDNPMVS